jgi:hypothetical protein
VNARGSNRRRPHPVTKKQDDAAGLGGQDRPGAEATNQKEDDEDVPS